MIVDDQTADKFTIGVLKLVVSEINKHILSDDGTSRKSFVATH